MSPKAPLRIGLRLDSPLLKRFQAEILREIQEGSFARIELLSYNPQAAKACPDGRSRWSAGRRKRLAFDLYQHWDRDRVKGSRNPLEDVDCSELLRDVPALTGSLERETVDLILCFGPDIRSGTERDHNALPAAPRFGVWTLRPADTGQYGGEPAYFWEMYERNAVSGITLEVTSGDPKQSRVLCKGFYNTARSVSLAQNRRQPYWGAVSLVTQKLRDLYDFGWEHLVRSLPSPEPPLPSKRIHELPTNWQMLRWFAPKFIHAKTGRYRQKETTHWRIAIRTGKSLQTDTGGQPDLSGFRSHESPKGHYYADPFLIEQGGKTWLFFEDYDYATLRGALRCAEVFDDARLGEAQTVLERPYHLSYPCLFRDQGELFMVPESGENGTIDLYRSTGFPNQWVLEKQLMRGLTADSTIFKTDGVYWMFTSMIDKRAWTKQLFLFHTQNLLGEWTPHPGNPISSDVRTNRCAGAVLSENGRLLRPSQDGSRGYGYSFTLHEITKLNPREYAERALLTIEPTWAPGLCGTHTYARCGGVEAIDAASRLPTSEVVL